MSYHNSLSGISDGSGTALDPYGGIGGAGESDLAKLVASGIKFSPPPNPKDQFQVGAINREKYVFVVGSDHMFYKFKYPNSGIGNTPSDSQAKSWFNGVVSRNTKTGTVSKTGSSPAPSISASGAGLKNTAINALPGLKLPVPTKMTIQPLPPGGGGSSIVGGFSSYAVPAIIGLAGIALAVKLATRKRSAVAA